MLMDAMKVDMANFQLQSIKPHLVQQSVEYERKKFKDYLQSNPGDLHILLHMLLDSLLEYTYQLFLSQRCEIFILQSVRVCEDELTIISIFFGKLPWMSRKIPKV